MHHKHGMRIAQQSRAAALVSVPPPSRTRRQSWHTPLGLLAVTSMVVASLAGAWALTPAASAAASTPPGTSQGAKATAVYRNLALPDGDTATVYSNGLAEILSRGKQAVEYRVIPPSGLGVPGTSAALPPKAQLLFDLSKAPASPYVAGDFEVVLAPSVTATAPTRVVGTPTLARLHRATPRPGAPAAGPVPSYTTSGPLNRTLAGLGVSSMSQVFRGVPASTLGSLAAAARRNGASLNLNRAYVVHITSGTMATALATLSASPQVAYVSPDWTVAPMNTSPATVPAATRRAAAAMAATMAGHPAAAPTAAAAGLPSLPSNYALQASAQSLLNRPGVNWVPAYEALESKYHQLPGTGETITDVSLGDLDSAGLPASDPCSFWSQVFGPTTIIQNGQRYLNLPSMPLIPTWTASSSATLDPTGEVCGVDPYDTEIGLDFSMMAPLPHQLQRPGAVGSGLTDLLGLAPGANFRLVVPSSTSGSITSVDAAFLAAAQQSPRPDVITASLGFGLDAYGFPSRYLEDDPLTEALLTALVHQDHINVSISANDGLRTSTNAAVSPTGGSAATNVALPGSQPTNLNDVELSTVPSRDLDSGSIDAGGTTLDDIFAAPPQNPAYAQLAAQQAFPEVRWDGFTTFSSGFGSRVNLSAPSDNLLGLEHAFGGSPTSVNVVDIGGTSASAQEVGAAAAVAQQAARLAGNTAVADNPLALRSFLTRTGTPVPAVPQADQNIDVGPQVNIGNAVTQLLGGQPHPGVARVAVAQRQAIGGFGAFFTSGTDPAAISLAGHNQNALVTIAPDWIGMPPGTSYRLSAAGATGSNTFLAAGPTARLRPDAILAAAGVAPSPTQPATVTLTYTAQVGGHALAQATIPLTFSPQSGSPEPLAPVVPAVVDGSSFTVHYNLTGQSAFTDPQLVVSAPGRMDPNDFFYDPIYSVPLSGTTGTVSVPVSALQGGGMYGVAIQAAPGQFDFSDFAYTRVQAAPSDAQPTAPLLSTSGVPSGHLLTVPYGGSVTVSWDVRNVPNAVGAILEVSAPGPGDWNSYAMFNNPGGTIQDRNGRDTGSVYFARLPGGPSGTTTIPATTLHLAPAMYQSVRVLPVLASGPAAGEASQVSTVSMNGVAAADGGSVIDGFGVNAHGSDGFITSNEVNSAGQPQSSVETFSQSTNAITHTVVSQAGGDQYSTNWYGSGAGIFAGDTGLYADNGPTSTTYDLIHPVADGTPDGHWTPPASLLPSPAAPNIAFQPAPQQTGPGVFLSAQNGPYGNPQVFTSNVAANTFGPAYSIKPAVASFAFPFYDGIGTDTATRTAVLSVSDFFNLSAPPTLVTVSTVDGTLGVIPGVGSGYTTGLAVDSAAGTAVGPESGGIGVYNLATGTGSLVSPGGEEYQHPAADNVHSEFAMQEVVSPGFLRTTPGLGSTPDNNTVGSEVITNGNGQFQQRISQFNFFNVFTLIAGSETQLNPATQTGYTLGPGGQELAPFHY